MYMYVYNEAHLISSESGISTLHTHSSNEPSSSPPPPQDTFITHHYVKNHNHNKGPPDN